MNLLDTLNDLQYILYLLFFIGFYMVFSDSFFESIATGKAKRTNAENALKGKEQRKSSKEGRSMSDYISDMLSITDGDDSSSNVKKFYEKSVGIAIIMFLISYLLMTVKVAPIALIIGLFLPFLIKRTKLQDIRNETSREGEILVQEILTNYKIYHKNMREAVRNAIETLGEDAPHSKKLLIELSYTMNSASPKEAKRAIDKFKFGIGTTWANMLSTNLELSLLEGLDVTSSMEDLIRSISKARKKMEETKRQGNEGHKMLIIMVPAIYLLTVISAVSFFGMSLSDFFYNQFRTNMGSTWFFMIVISYVLSMLISSLISKDKMDI